MISLKAEAVEAGDLPVQLRLPGHHAAARPLRRGGARGGQARAVRQLALVPDARTIKDAVQVRERTSGEVGG